MLKSAPIIDSRYQKQTSPKRALVDQLASNSTMLQPHHSQARRAKEPEHARGHKCLLVMNENEILIPITFFRIWKVQIPS